jgi:hypothetical protein
MLRTREMFVPLSHCPGHAQADFGEADGYIGGKKPQRSQAADRQRAGLCAVHGCRLLRGAVGPAHVAQREAVLQRLSCGGPNKRIKMNPARKTHSRESHTVEQQRLEVTPLISTLVGRGVSETQVSRELGVEVGRGAELWF